MSLSLKLNEALATLPVYQPGRPIEEVARELGLPVADIIKMASNENPLGPSPMAVEAMCKAASQVNLYPDGNSFYLKQKLAAHLGVATENLILGCGSNEIIEFIGHALMRPGSEVIVSQYCFAIYPIVAKMFGATVVTVPAKNYGHDLKAMLQAVTPATSVLFVANPNNPTGTLASAAEMLDLIEKVPDHVLLAIDEAYVEFLDDPNVCLSAIKSGRKPNVILLRTFSKIYGLAGLRLGYGIGNPELISVLEKIRQPFNINLMAQAGALAALDDVNHVRNTRQTNQQGQAFWEKSLREMKLEYVPSAGNFILIRVGKGQKVVEEMQRLGVITRPMGGYQLPEWLRISVGTPAENQRCLDALKKAIATT